MVELSKKEERPRIAREMVARAMVARLFILRFIERECVLSPPDRLDFVWAGFGPHSTRVIVADGGYGVKV